MGTTNYPPDDFAQRMIDIGAFFGCACGESFDEKEHAWACRKCPRYAPDAKRVAFDYRTGETHERPALTCRASTPADDALRADVLKRLYGRS